VAAFFVVFSSRGGAFKCDLFEEGGSNPDFKALANIRLFVEDSESRSKYDLAAFEKNTSGFDLDGLNHAFARRGVVTRWWVRLFNSLYIGQHL